MAEVPISPELVEEPKDFFPAYLDEVFKANIPSYSDCPSRIEIANTGLSTFLLNFRRETDRKMIATLKKANKLGRLAGQTDSQMRNYRDTYWKREYGQFLFDVNGEPVAAPFQTGNSSSIKIPLGQHGEFHTDQMRFSIHSHPSPHSFSPADLASVFAGMNAERFFGEDREVAYPPETMLAVSADNGYFFTHRTKDTIVPSYEEAVEDLIINKRSLTDSPGDERISNRYFAIWENLIERFGRQELEGFIGQKLEGERSYFPDEVNDLGKEIIVLQQTIDLTNKYKLPLYFSDKTRTELRRISTVEDYFQELST